MAFLDREKEERDGLTSDDAEVGAQLLASAIASIAHIEEMMIAYFQGLAEAARRRK